MPEDNRTLAQRGKDYITSQWGKVRDLASLATVDSVFDRFHRMSSIEQELGVPPERSAYIASPCCRSTVDRGTAMHVRRAKVGVARATVDDKTVGLLKALEPVKDDIERLARLDVSSRVGAEGAGPRNLMDDVDIAAPLSLPKGRKRVSGSWRSGTCAS